QTLQDRLVKELRLANISRPAEINKFLKEIFTPKFNEKYAVIPAKEGNIHKPLQLQEKEHLNHIFSIQQTRRINLDYTIQFKKTYHKPDQNYSNGAYNSRLKIKRKFNP